MRKIILLKGKMIEERWRMGVGGMGEYPQLRLVREVCGVGVARIIVS